MMILNTINPSNNCYDIKNFAIGKNKKKRKVCSSVIEA